MVKISDIISAIEDVAPLSLQESWDNSGLQIGRRDTECTGVLIAVDPTEDAVAEAAERGMNLLVTHHPLIFKPLRHLTGDTPAERAAELAIRRGIAIYSAHTSLDKAPQGLNTEAAKLLGLTDVEPLLPDPTLPGAGLGAVGTLPTPLTLSAFVGRIKAAFGSPVVRCSDNRAIGKEEGLIRRVALCTGAGGSMIPDAIAAHADAFLTSDTRYHDFLDYGRRDILIADIGHHESESCAREIFYRIISEKFPNFAVAMSASDSNPILYL